MTRNAMPRGTKGDAWSGASIEQIIDRELGRNAELRSGASAYASMLDHFRRTGNGLRFLRSILNLASREYRESGARDAELLTFGDGGAEFLYDLTRTRVVMVWGVSRSVAPNTRDDAYHAGYPTAGANLDKGHAWSHAQGGREGGPNYFRQARRLNQARSANGKLWRAIERHLATNSGLSAFIRLRYDAGNSGDKPDQVEYGILPASGLFRTVIFPNT